VSEERRAVLSRIGIVALNALLPGLGLQRLGRFKAALLFMSAPFVGLTATLLYYVLAPSLSFAGYALTSIALLILYFGAILISAAMSWRASRVRPEQAPHPWSRWYALLGIYVAVTVLGAMLVPLMHGFYKPFYIPSEAMRPTLLVNDRLLASMQGPGELRRGDIILFEVGSAIYIKRVAALPGDRIAMREGIVILNGSPVAQRFVRTETVAEGPWGNQARKLTEQLPGESRAHEIYDMGASPGDDMAEQTVRPDHVFVLGDNRDQSADSRYSRSEMGVEQLPIADIRGKALFHTWGPSGRMGEPFNR
jgi:signal peptidase I